jgi:serine/threonine-protein kinase
MAQDAVATSVRPAMGRLRVLLFSDIVSSVELKARLGQVVYDTLFKRHNTLFEEELRGIAGARIVGTRGDGYFAEFENPSDAVTFALRFQARMKLEPWTPTAIQTRIGIHIGQVMPIKMGGHDDYSGQAADVAARLMSLAAGGQILLTRQPFDDARQFVRECPTPLCGSPPLKWLAHGPYLITGVADEVDVYEVGIEGLSPLVQPRDSEKAKRVAPPDQEVMFGPGNPRPAVGMEVPGRPHWKLVEKLDEGGFGEVWLAERSKLDDRHVFKFCFDADRLRSLKREYTLFRLLKLALGERADIARLYDYNFDRPPFFLESEYTQGGNLIKWSDGVGGIGKLPLERRLGLVASVAEAVAAAHSVGVLHKDIKPSNILMHINPDGSIQPRLSDFGIGVLTELDRLEKLDITPVGFDAKTDLSSRTGTRMYAAPEASADRPFTPQGDIYSLGVLLYQMVVGDLGRAIGTGWERDIHDPVLRRDIADCVDRDASRRLASTAELALRLRNHRQRLSQHQRARVMRVALGGTVVSALLALVAALALLKHSRDLKYERDQKQQAYEALERANADANLAINMIDGVARTLNPQEANRSPQARVQSLIQQLGGYVDKKDAPLQQKFAAFVCLIVGKLMDDGGQSSVGVPILEQAVKLHEARKAPPLELADSYRKLGWAYLHSNREADALKAMDSAVTLADSVQPPDQQFIALARGDRSHVLWGMGKFQEFEQDFLRAMLEAMPLRLGKPTEQEVQLLRKNIEAAVNRIDSEWDDFDESRQQKAEQSVQELLNPWLLIASVATDYGSTIYQRIPNQLGLAAVYLKVQYGKRNAARAFAFTGYRLAVLRLGENHEDTKKTKQFFDTVDALGPKDMERLFH